ncbi:hypothetical protein NEIELOOT_01958 [Neisseria elongata subsp. glycolytica ATCC 29315]|uniref:Uncharacterized protein n=1 Tax=Neisseria elongata subsp. glycolytica ATCC 29315 TaxID=546263 RepID=D4DSB4_NEIEG|nr:hypothetical protein NEIELOOT_01958 [Neisseria elongata subsp. glycolytica ATCC 29315]
MLKAGTEKVCNSQDQMGNFSIEIETVKYQKKMLDMKNTTKACRMPLGS